MKIQASVLTVFSLATHLCFAGTISSGGPRTAIHFQAVCTSTDSHYFVWLSDVDSRSPHPDPSDPSATQKIVVNTDLLDQNLGQYGLPISGVRQVLSQERGTNLHFIGVNFSLSIQTDVQERQRDADGNWIVVYPANMTAQLLTGVPVSAQLSCQLSLDL